MSHRALVPSQSTLPSRVILGGIYASGYLVLADNHSIKLPQAPFHVLCELACARLTSVSGFTDLHRFSDDRDCKHQTVHRLRRLIDAELGSGMGNRLVEHGTKSHYRLTIEPEKLWIALEFSELTPMHLPQTLVDDIVHELQHRGRMLDLNQSALQVVSA